MKKTVTATADRPVLVTGGAGFIGCNLADRLAAEGETVVILDSLAREGVASNVEWLKARHGTRIDFVRGDIRDPAVVGRPARSAKAVFHFAAQVAVTTSLADPREDFAINTMATLALLEVLRESNPVPLIYASTNKVYGDLSDLPLALAQNGYAPSDPGCRAHGIDESRPLDFHTPYGCSKGAADQYVLDYARSFGLPTAVLRMSCIYGPRQMGTEDQGWVAHFLLRALHDELITIYGDGHQVRDVLFVDDAVDAYMRVWRDIDRLRGRAYNLGGGPANAVSLQTVIAEIERLLERPVRIERSDWRPGDQRYYVSDTRALQHDTNVRLGTGWKTGLERLATSLQERHVLPDRTRVREMHP